jgi:hypothetical protein
MEIISKETAARFGLKRYFTDIACSKGHVAERTISRNDCTECLAARQLAWFTQNRESENARSRQWYAENKEKAAVTRASWRERNAEKDRADIAAYQAANRDRLDEAAEKWRKENPDKVRGYIARYKEENPERILEIDRAWRARNKGKINAKKKRREANKLKATPAWADLKAITRIYEEAARLTAETGIPHHVDHIYPLQSDWICGLHVEDNLQILPASINQSKSNRRLPEVHG